MKTNTKTIVHRFTHEGAKASNINAEQELRRSVLSCLLFEDQFYENGESIADRIAKLVPKVKPQVVANLALEARTKNKLRHIPLFLVREMARHDSHKPFVKDALINVIQRPDELGEFLSLYWKAGKCPIANSVKSGLAQAFNKFDEFQISKWNKDADIKLRDVLFMVHARPKDKDQEILWKKLINNELRHPDSWETAISAAKPNEKLAAWTRLLEENKLGAMALLRNLRNCQQAGVDENLLRVALRNCNPERVLPYRFISAAKYAPKLEPELEQLMFSGLKSFPKLHGKTVLLVDRSGSMNNQVSAKSDITRIEAACGLAMMAREICEEVVIYGFSNGEVLIPTRRGFALKDAIMQGFGGSTKLKKSMDAINEKEKYNRLLIFTDEGTEDGVGEFKGSGYMLNVASYQNGVAYDKCVHINGFSETSLSFIQELEMLKAE